MANEETKIIDAKAVEVKEAKPTLKERIKNIPVKKVLKVGGILAGAIVGTIILGKIATPDSDWDEDEPFDEDYTPDEDRTSDQ